MLTVLCSTNQLQAQRVNFNGGDEGVDFLDELYVQQESALCSVFRSFDFMHVTSLGFSIPK